MSWDILFSQISYQNLYFILHLMDKGIIFRKHSISTRKFIKEIQARHNFPEFSTEFREIYSAKIFKLTEIEI